MLFVLVIGAELKKATVAAEPVVLDTAEATAKVVRQLLQAKAPVAVDFEETRAPPPRARAREGEPEDRERLGGHRALRIQHEFHFNQLLKQSHEPARALNAPANFSGARPACGTRLAPRAFMGGGRARRERKRAGWAALRG